MTKRACILVAAALWLAACGNSQTATDMKAATDGGATDQGLPDLPSPPDMSAMLGCKGLLACQAACMGDRNCSMMCRTQATMQAGTLSRALSGCQRMTCDATPSDGGVDGGSLPCMRNMPPSAECTACLTDSTESTGSCAHPADPACGACVNQFNACQADLP